MRKVKLFLLFALAAMYAGATTFSVIPYYSYPELWADVNGDGVKEVLMLKNFTAVDSSSIPQEVFSYTNSIGDKRYAMSYADAEKKDLIGNINYQLAKDNNLISRDGNYYVKLSYVFYGEDPENIFGEKWEDEIKSQYKIETIIEVNGVKYALVTPENIDILYGGTSGMGNYFFVFIDGKLCVDVTSLCSHLPEMVHFGYYFCNVSGDIVAVVRESVQKRESYNYPEWWEKLSIYSTDTDNDGIPEVFVSDNFAKKMELMKLAGNKFESVSEFPAAQYFYMDNIKLPLLPTDINIDGHTDYYYYAEDGIRYILIQLADNSFDLQQMSITTDEEIIGQQEIGVKSNYGNKFIKPTINMTGFSGGDYIPTKFADNISISADVNLDGYPDLIDTENGSAFLSLGDGRTYYPANFGGKMEVVDLNGDGISDFVVFDSESGQVFTRMSSTEGYVEKNLLKNSGLSRMYVCDFNGDNYADILLSIDYLGTYSYLIFYANDGKGNFKKTENSYNGEYRFRECADLYGDDSYSIIATHQDNYSYSVVEFNVPKNLKPTPTKLLDSFNNGGYGVIDYDADGYMDVAYMSKFNEFATVKTGKVQNTAPVVSMPKINVDKENGIIRVEWEPATDAQTSATDIRYIVGVGTEPDKYNIARMDAARELYTMMRTVSLAQGEYYVAVQAIDAGGMKSKWSEPIKYEHSGLYADFSAENFTYVGKDMKVLLNTPYNPDYKYEYEVGEGGEIVSSEKGGCVVKYNSLGAKKIKLTITSDSEVAVATRDLEVYAGEPNLAKSNLDTSASQIEYQSYFVDLDGNGLPEAIQYKLYENDGKGVYTLSGKMFNIDMYITGVLVDDVNMDGMPDIISTDYGSEYVLLNEGDLGFEKEDLKYTIEDITGAVYDDIRIEFGENTIFDFDNDGRLDVFGQLLNHSSFAGYGVFRNIGKNKYKFFPVSEKNNDKIYGDQYSIADFNSDGLMDILLFNERIESYLAINEGNCKFSLINVGSNFPEYDFSNPARISSVEDVNNDGYQDIIFNIGYRNPVTRIYFGDKSFKFDKVASLEGVTLTALKIDINNDGIIDFTDDYRNLYFWQPDGTFWMEAFDYNTNNHSYRVVQYEEDYRMHYKYADVDGDGTPDAMGGKRRTLQNSKPTAPAGVTATASAKGVLISWTASKDEETPAHQLLYMISLKKKGATGENAYIMSPMNCENDKAQMSAMLTRRALRGVTSVLVPIDRFDSKSEYEVKVQAIDSWYASSPFSETYTFKVGSVSDIEAPAVTGAGVRTHIKYVGNETSAQTWDWDGGNAVLESGVYTVTWNEAGVKNISCTVSGTKVETSIMVKARPDLRFEIPSKVLGGASVKIKLPAIFTEPLSPVELTASDGVEVDYQAGSDEAILVFPKKAGRYDVYVTYNDDVFGTLSTSIFTEVVDFVPSISIVSVDGATGKNKVEWNVNTISEYSSLFKKVRIYKEVGSTDNFELIGEAEISAGSYVDMQSNPNVRKNRYLIALSTIYDGETAYSPVHGSVHLMVNKGLGTSINLMWNAYEGGIVNQYYILRGATPDNLEVYETLTGHETSFTDTEVPAEGCYYAISYGNLMPVGTRAGNTGTGSNVVCSRDASEVTFVENIAIKSVEKDASLSNEQRVLHLYAMVTPARATYGDVQWRIIEGADYAEISSDGTLSALNKAYKGIIKVEAKAKDGSGVTANLEVPADITSESPILVESITIDPTVWAGVVGDEKQLTVTVLPNNATDKSVIWSSNNETVATVDNSGLVKLLDAGKCTITVATTDGSNLSAECIITSESGIDDIFTDDNATFDIYNLKGILLYKDCNKEQIKQLIPGIYVIHCGKEVKTIFIRENSAY